MRRRGESPPARRRGFLLPVVLGLILVAAVLALHALSGSASAAARAGNRILHQRAFEAAERGLAGMRERLAAGGPGPTQPLRFASAALPSEHALVEYRVTARLALSPGYSGGRFIEERAELRSRGRVTDGATATLVEGLSRIVPAQAGQ